MTQNIHEIFGLKFSLGIKSSIDLSVDQDAKLMLFLYSDRGSPPEFCQYGYPYV